MWLRFLRTNENSMLLELNADILLKRRRIITAIEDEDERRYNL